MPSFHYVSPTHLDAQKYLYLRNCRLQSAQRPGSPIQPLPLSDNHQGARNPKIARLCAEHTAPPSHRLINPRTANLVSSIEASRSQISECDIDRPGHSDRCVTGQWNALLNNPAATLIASGLKGDRYHGTMLLFLPLSEQPLTVRHSVECR